VTADPLRPGLVAHPPGATSAEAPLNATDRAHSKD
jgi:hypothetical protein